MATLTVGTDEEYATLAAAIAASQNGDVIDVDAGTYVNDFATVTTNITIQGVGGMVDLVATEDSPNGKAILTTDADVTIANVAFSGATSTDGNGAGIRAETGNLTLVADDFSGNQEGLLADSNPAGSIDIDSSEFGSNGSGNGLTHNIYVNEVGALNVVDSYIHDAAGGDEIKSRALNTMITDTRIIDGSTQTAGGYDVDLPNGGNATLTGDTIEKGAKEPNGTMIHFGGEAAPYAGSLLTVTDDVLVNDDNPSVVNGRAVNNDQSAGAGATADVRGNTIYNVTASRVLTGPGVSTPNTLLSSTAALDTSSPYLAAAIVDVTTPATVMATMGQAINPFASTVLTVVDNASVTITLGGASRGVLGYAGGDNAISVTQDDGMVAITGLASDIASDFSAGLFTYTGDYGTGADTVTATFDDPNLFLLTAPGDADAAANSFDESIEGVACFVAGTLITTPSGDRAVEGLAIGDLVTAVDGSARPIRWIGRRSYVGRFLAGRNHLLPIRITAGALGDGVPRRDLLVSPLHALLLCGVLAPAGALVNHSTILHEKTLSRVDYVHLELDTHDAIWAEGAAAETFLDDGSRGLFHNAAEYAVNRRDGDGYCAPRVSSGYAVEAIRHRLAKRVAPSNRMHA